MRLSSIGGLPSVFQKQGRYSISQLASIPEVLEAQEATPLVHLTVLGGGGSSSLFLVLFSVLCLIRCSQVMLGADAIVGTQLARLIHGESV